MTHRRWLTATLLILGMGWLASPGDAQEPAPPRPSHVPIPRGDDPEKLFQDRLRELQARQDLTKLLTEGDLKKLIQEFQRSGIKADDPRLKEHIKNHLHRTGPDGKPMSLTPEEIERLNRWLNDVLKGGKLLDKPIPPDNGKTRTPPDGTGKTQPVDPPGTTKSGKTMPPVDPAAQAEAREQIVQLARRLEKMARNVQESPVLQDALRDMSKSLLDMQSNMLPEGERLDTQLAALNKMARDTGGWFKDSFKSLGKFKMPAMPKVDLPSVGMPSLGSLPTVSMPRGLSALPDGPAPWQTILLVIVACVLGVIAWKLMGRLIVAQRNKLASGWRLGPCPIDPSQVTTRQDVVRAFEYLSLLRLGAPAESWNHREIASRLGGETAERRMLVAELADLYEQARYTPDDEPMPAESIAAARRDLCLLAGVSAA